MDVARPDVSFTFPHVHISGNARVILGSVYGLDREFFQNANREDYKLLLLDSLKEPAANAGSNLSILSNQLSVLLLNDYGDVQTSLAKIGRRSTIADDFAVKIDVQEKIFRGTLQRLIAVHMGNDRAQQMLHNCQDPGWSDPSFLQYIDERFSDNTDTLRGILQLISDNLNKISSFASKCKEARTGLRQVR